MVEIPVGDKALERPDGYRVVKLPTPAPALAGVVTDTTTNSREWVTLPDGINRLWVFTSSNMGNIFGDINPYRTGMLAWRYHQGVTDSSRAPFFLYVNLIFL